MHDRRPAGDLRSGSVFEIDRKVLVDDAAGYVFISEGFFADSLQTTGGGILVTDLGGNIGASTDLDPAPASLAPAGQYGAPPNNSLAGAVAVASDGRIAVAASGGDVALSYLRTLTASDSADAARLLAADHRQRGLLSGPADRPIQGNLRNAGHTSAPHLVVIRLAQASVALTLHGFYKTSRHGSVVYHLYHHTATVRAVVQVTPVRPGECVLLQLQEFNRSKWETKLKTKCAALGPKGEATATIPAKKAVLGRPYRLRADFLPSHDTTIRAAESDWQYLMIKKRRRAGKAHLGTGTVAGIGNDTAVADAICSGQAGARATRPRGEVVRSWRPRGKVA